MNYSKNKLTNILKAFINKFKSNKAFRFSLIWLIIAVVLEIAIFNFNTYILMFGDYNKTELSLSQASLTGFTLDENEALHNNGIRRTKIEFTDLNIPVGTIYLDIECSDNITQTTASIDIADSTHNEQYRTGVAYIDIINGFERSQTIPCQFSGNVSDLRLNFNFSKDQSVILKGITINKPIKLNFSLLRFAIIYFTVLFAYFMIASIVLKKSYNEKSTLGFRLIVVITSIFLFFAMLSSSGYRSRNDGAIIDDFKSEKGSQITQELVDAFEKGQLELLEEPSAALENIENPYDRSQRNVEKVSYLWDHCYYNNHYYSYYGIAPVVLLFLPYHMITGFYFPSIWAVLLFSMIGIIFLSKLYLLIIEKWFKHLRLNFVILGLIFLQISSGIWFSISRAEMYEIAISSGFASVLVGSYFLISSNVVGDGKISKIRLALATTFLSIGVLCRPTLGVYCVAALAFIAYGYKKLKKSDNYNKKAAVKFFLSALLPFVVIGGIQMAYNWLRFDSPLDFGIQYSLTINDFTNSQFHIHFVSICLYAFLFAAPHFRPDFPFVHSSFENININGYLFVDDKWVNGIAIGLFFRALPMFAYFFSRRAYKLIEKPKQKKALILVGITCVVAPLAILVAVWESGYAVRYNADFSWQMLIGALVILFTVLMYCKNESVLKIATTVLTVSVILCIMINFAQIYSFINPQHVSKDVSAALYYFERLFEFWR